MNESFVLPSTELATSTVVVGTVEAVTGEGVVVSSRAFGDKSHLCDILYPRLDGKDVHENDHVLVWVSGEEGQRDVVLGRIGPPIVLEPGDPADDLVLEAKHSLTLRVGAGSITIREDGKILIKGKDLVSHAQRLNRIKGGAVQIN